MIRYHCKYKDSPVELRIEVRRPKLSDKSANRVKNFGCSKSEACELYKQKKCEYVVKNIDRR